MPHPFTNPESKGLRDRVSALVQNGLHRTAATNIIFVCGGDGEKHLRPKFIEYMAVEMLSYRPFRPEAAQEDFFEQDQENNLNLSVFEELVSNLSLGIVLFAESPGSYAETGLFSALDNARRKTLVIMDADLQGPGSFLAFGPVAVISNKSRLGAALQLSYEKPNFDLIKQRIESRLPVRGSFRAIGSKDFSELLPIEIMALTWFYVDLLRVCSIEDLVYCFNSAFNGHAGIEKIKEILSVLVGAGLVVRDGPIGLVRLSDDATRLVEPSAAYVKRLQTLHIEIADIIERGCDANYQEVLANAA